MNTPVFARLLASLTALTLAAPALAQDNGSVSEFELPSERATPRSQVQGPVLEGIPAPRVARGSPTPAPAQPPVIEVDPGASTIQPSDPFTAIDAMGNNRPTPRATSAAATPTGQAAVPAPNGQAATAGEAAAGPAARPSIDLPRPAAAQPTVAAPAPAVAPSGGIAWWIWLVALLAVGALGAAAGWIWRGRSRPVMLPAPVIERPRVPERAPEPASPPAELPKVALTRKPAEPPPAAPAPAPAVAEEDHEDGPESPLRIALEPARLSVSLLNATLAYRILLTNQGETELRDISIDGDMVSAHASLSQEEQVAAPNSKLENRHLIRTLAPGETKVVNGEFALPLPLIRPIRKGEATLFVPLARLRIVAGGEHMQMLVQTSVVGQRSPRPGGGLRPFRLDLGPRIYSELGQRAFA